MNIEIVLELPGCDPMELLRAPTPDGVWVRWDRDDHWPLIQVRGELVAVVEFCVNHWDEENALYALIEAVEFGRIVKS